MSFEFLPGFSRAAAANTRFITQDALAGDCPVALSRAADIFDRARQNDYREQIQGRQRTAQHMRRSGSTVDLGDPSASSWSELRRRTAGWLARHLGHMQAYDRQNGNKSTIAIGLEGVAASNAFLEVIPKVLACCGVEMPVADDAQNEAVHRYAQHSQGFITAWARIGVSVDRALAQSLSAHSAESHRRKDVFFDLHFRPELFRVDEDSQRIGVDPGAPLRNWAGKNVYNITQKPAEELYGCPALHMIPPMYQAMEQLAYQSGLYAPAYAAALQEAA